MLLNAQMKVQSSHIHSLELPIQHMVPAFGSSENRAEKCKQMPQTSNELFQDGTNGNANTDCLQGKRGIQTGSSNKASLAAWSARSDTSDLSSWQQNAVICHQVKQVEQSDSPQNQVMVESRNCIKSQEVEGQGNSRQPRF